MTILSGVMIIKNGVKFDYPFIEAASSILPICDEFVFLEGNGDDGTWEALQAFQAQHPQKVKLYRDTWPECHKDGAVLAEMTNRAIEKCTGRYYWNIQADEAIHECYHEPIRRVCEEGKWDLVSTGVWHFFSNFDTVYQPGVFYDWFFRLAKRSTYPNIRSLGDAMAIGNATDKPYQVASFLDIKTYHYGYVRKPKCLIEKQASITTYWGYQGWGDLDPYLMQGHKTGTIKWHDKHPPEQLRPFVEQHPASMLEWIQNRRDLVKNGTVQS